MTGAGPQPVGQWRATYTPGDWLVLCGPTSLVVVEPPGAGWTPLVAELWQQVLASSSLVDLAARLAGYGLDTMPSFGALFWTPDGMRSLVRGSVVVLDPTDGRVVASGKGIQTWSEVGLRRLSTVLVHLGDGPATRPSEATGLQLPLVVGAVQASAVLLDAREEAQVRSPQGVVGDLGAAAPPFPQDHLRTAAVPPETTAALPDEDHDEDGDGRVEATELLPDPTGAEPPAGGTEADRARAALEDADTEPVLLTEAPAPTGQGAVDPSAPLVDAVVCPSGHANPPGELRCRGCGVTLTDQRRRQVPQPALAILRVSDGAEALVDRPVLVGRAPTERGAGPVRLLTVPSPEHDISRTHLQVGVEGWRVTVTDLHSTNGTVLVDPDGGQRRTLPPGQPVPVVAGNVLELAEGVSVLVSTPR